MLVAAVVGATATVVGIRAQFGASADELLRESRRALAAREYERAERFAARVPRGAPEFPQACLVAGEAATKLRRLPQALSYYDRLRDDGSDAAISARACGGDILLQLGRPSEAERNYRRVLARRPEDQGTRAQLSALLTAYGRRNEAIPYLLELVRAHRFSIEHLIWLGNGQSLVELPQPARTADPVVVTDPNVLISLARFALAESDPARAQSLARRAVSLDPEQTEAWALWGQALVHGSAAQFLEWHWSVPRVAEEHPDVWRARGLWARERSEEEAAARCFWEALCREPCHRAATYELGQTLAALGRSEEASVFLTRAERLLELEGMINGIYLERRHLDRVWPNVRRAAELSHSLGQLWEAAAWARVALTIRPRDTWAIELLQHSSRRLAPDFPRVAPESDAARQIDLSTLALPEWPKRVKPVIPQAVDVVRSPASLRFTDEAFQSGIQFEYFNGYSPPRDGLRMIAAMGGGVAVLDFDGDGWPDVYFTQGCSWPPRADDYAHIGRLYRNLGNGRFEDVTGRAGLRSTGYGQGGTSGDFDNDGFPDLYVANIGPNRLYRNNGDGTVSELTLTSGIEGDQWTASCLLADLNGDSFPDIYDVNYLAGPRAYEVTCRNSRGNEQMCEPGLFDAAQDQLFLNLQDGRFQEITQTAGIVLPDGKGLGIVAADFNRLGRLDLFVANDGTANFYFVNETPGSGASPVFREQALVSGLAFSAEGDAQACMGVAVDDVDGDGRFDLFVTNYYRESNTLYRQLHEGLFVDGTRAAGLREPSFLMLGFGTQFLDADLDGDPDLVITNGHVSDYTADGEPYQMRPQFLQNEGDGRFLELPAKLLGPFFESRRLGRGLARLDWNRDGREDFAVSHLDSPAALVSNGTEPTGRFLALRLRGVVGSRDAIGTTVRVTAAGRAMARQLTAGDGYYASNQRQLVFGLGSADRADTVSVRWPSGLEQTFKDVPCDREFVLIESQDRLHELPQAR